MTQREAWEREKRPLPITSIRQHGCPHRAGFHREQAPEPGDDVGEVVLRAEALPFEHFDDGGNLPTIGDGRFLDRHAVAFGAVGAHLPFGFHSCASFCASAIWAGVICLAIESRSWGAGLSPFVAARLYHL